MKLAVFDFDGTLVDSLPDIAEFVNLTLKEFKKEPLSEEVIKGYIGNGARNLIIRAFGSDDKIEEKLSFYNKHYNDSKSKRTKLFDGIGKTLTELKKRGYVLAVLSNKPQSTIDTVFNRLLKEFDFAEVIGGGEFPLKPDPAALTYLKNKFGDESDIYMIGDGETDILTAKNGNVTGVAALWGYRSKEQLLSVGAKIFAKTPEGLLEILK